MMSFTIRCIENTYVVTFQYSPDRIRAIKSIRRATFHAADRSWRFPCEESIRKQLDTLAMTDQIIWLDHHGKGAVIVPRCVVPDNTDQRDRTVLSKKPQYGYDHVDFPQTNAGLPPQHESAFQKYRQELILSGYSIKTRKAYEGHLRRFLTWLGGSRQPDAQFIREYVQKMLEKDGLSHSFANQFICAINYFGTRILGGSLESFPRPKKESTLPQVLSQNEVTRIFEKVENVKHRTLLFMVYASGLRVGEVVRLQVQDIDSGRMMIRIQQSKGRKDRYVMLSEKVLASLRLYYKTYRPTSWLFPGQSGHDSHITERTAQHVFEHAREKSGIRKKVGIHVLRNPNLNKIQTSINYSIESSISVRRKFGFYSLYRLSFQRTKINKCPLLVLPFLLQFPFVFIFESCKRLYLICRRYVQIFHCSFNLFVPKKKLHLDNVQPIFDPMGSFCMSKKMRMVIERYIFASAVRFRGIYFNPFIQCCLRQLLVTAYPAGKEQSSRV